MGFQVLALATSTLSAMAQLSAGEKAKEAYEQRARNEELNSRIEAVNAKKKGVEALKRTNASLASILAGSPKQGLGFSGTVLDRGVFLVQRPASDDFSDTAFNASMALATGQMRASDYRAAGEQARLQGQIGAFSTMATAFGNMSSIGGSSGGLSPSV
jgi:hypothetical protein